MALLQQAELSLGSLRDHLLPVGYEASHHMLNAIELDPEMAFNDWWDVYRKELADEQVGICYSFAQAVWKMTSDYRARYKSDRGRQRREKAARRKFRGKHRRKKKAVL